MKKILKIKTARTRVRRECVRNGCTFHAVATVRDRIRHGRGKCFVEDAYGTTIHSGDLLHILEVMGLIGEDEELQSFDDFSKEKAIEYKERKNAKRNNKKK